MNKPPASVSEHGPELALSLCSGRSGRGAAEGVGQSVGSRGRHRRFCVYAGAFPGCSEEYAGSPGFLPDPECPCQPKPAGRERTPPAFPEGPQYNPPEVYQPAGDTGGKCGGHSKRAGTAIRLLGRGGTAQEPSCSFGRGSRYRGRSGKCTLIHTQRHGRDFMRSSFIWARRAVGVPDC